MPKYGISLKIDVTKLDKTRFFKGQKGTYADLTCFVDTEASNQYGSNGIITQSVSQEERQNGVKMPILGNTKVFYSDGGQDQNSQQNHNQDTQHYDCETDIPF